MPAKNFYLAVLLSFLFCAGSVEASKQSSDNTTTQPRMSVGDVLQNDKADFIKKMSESNYYNLQESLEDAGDDYLYLANLLSQWGRKDFSVQQLTEQLVVQLEKKGTDPNKPWETLLLNIANRYIEKNKRENKGLSVFKSPPLDAIIANYNLMSFTDVKTIQQKAKDGDGKYRLLNDWGVLFFHCNEEAIAYRNRKKDRKKYPEEIKYEETKREFESDQDDQWMEERHDYVQIWYPIFSVSDSYPHAPRMSPVLFQKIKQNGDLYDIYRQSIGGLFDRTLNFMGLEYDASDQKIIKNNNKSQHINWIRRDHNFLRINRYLQALSIVGMDKERDALLKYLESGVDNWEQFCDNDPKAIEKLEYTKKGKIKGYRPSMEYWVNAKAENEGYMSQVDESISAASPQDFQSSTKPISNTQPTVMVDSPAPQPISSDNSAAPQQKIRKNKAQGKRQRRRGKKTYRKSNRKSRKTRKKR